MRSNFYKWKSRFTIQESEEKGERKTGDVGREGRWMKGKLLWFIVWYEDMESQSGDLQPQLYDMSLKHQSKHFLVKSILSHEWKPLAIDDLRWIKYSALIFLQPLSCQNPHSHQKHSGCEISRESRRYGEGERTARSWVVFLSLWLVKYHPYKLFLLPQKRAMANCFNGFPLR